jgi:hypothetical protein
MPVPLVPGCPLWFGTSELGKVPRPRTCIGLRRGSSQVKVGFGLLSFFVLVAYQPVKKYTIM